MPRGFPLILGTLLLSCGLFACSSGDSGGGGGTPAAGTAVSGTVSAPGGTVAKAEPASLLKWFASLFVSESRAQAINGFVGVANVPVVAFNINDQGTPIPHGITGLPDLVIIAQTTSAANGSFTLNLPTGFTPAINTVVQAAPPPAAPVGIKTAGNAVHAFLIGNPVDVDPATEAALEALIDYLPLHSGVTLQGAMTTTELSQLMALVRAEVAARPSLVSSTTTDTVTNILAPAGLKTLIDDALTAIGGAGQDPLTILTTALPDGTASTCYSATLWAIGGTGTQTWRVVPSGIGVLPAGLTLNNAGLVAGGPTTSGQFNFTVQVSAVPPQVAMQDIGLFIAAGGVPSTTFPLVASGSKRYLQDQNCVPFPILGRTAWFITSLLETDYKSFIDDTAAKGYNAIEFHVVNHDPRGNNPPFGFGGNNALALPFTKRLDTTDWTGSLSYGGNILAAPDFSQRNEMYWQHVDALLAYAESKGILCFMFPAYVGFGGGDQGWMQEMVANGPVNMQNYGAFIANRYKTRGNIVWMLGGDYGTGGFPFIGLQLDVEKAMLAGMQSVAGQLSTQFSAEWANPSIYTDQADPILRAAGTLEGVYTGSNNDINTHSRRGYSYFPALPTFLLEEPYDEEGPDGNIVNSAATQPVRRFQWWGWLSGIGGYISGNGCVWPFNSPTRSPFLFCQDGWQAHLNTQGAQDMARLNAFVKSIAWFNLVPSGLNGMRNLITSRGSDVWLTDYVAAAATPDGTLLVAYVPPAHSGPITVDMTGMSGPTRARWLDPTTAAYVAAVVGLLPPGTLTQDFTPPLGSHVDNFTDWVLLLEKQ